MSDGERHQDEGDYRTSGQQGEQGDQEGPRRRQGDIEEKSSTDGHGEQDKGGRWGNNGDQGGQQQHQQKQPKRDEGGYVGGDGVGWQRHWQHRRRNNDSESGDGGDRAVGDFVRRDAEHVRGERGDQTRKRTNWRYRSCPGTLGIATWNVERLSESKIEQLELLMEQYGLSILCIQETHKSGAYSYTMETGTLVVLSGGPQAEREYAGLGFMIAPNLVKSVMGHREHTSRFKAESERRQHHICDCICAPGRP